MDVDYSAADGYTFEYWVNKETDKKTKDVKTSDTPFVLYNGKAVIDVTADLLSPENGHVVLIDNNADDEYDIVDVWEYDLVYVFGVSQSSGNVTSSYDRSMAYRFDPEDEDYHVTFLNSYGGVAQLSDIKQYSVLYVYESLDKMEKKVVISNNRVSGMVSEASDDGYVINGTEYEVSPAVEGRLELAVSDEGDFYLDADNRIAGFEGTSVIRKNIGMFIAINDGGLRDGYQVKMLTQNSGVQIYNLASSIKVNDDKMTASEFYDLAFKDALFGTSDDPGYDEGQRPHPSRAGFLYKLNSKDEICEVVVVGENDGYLQVRQIGTQKSGSDTQLYYSKNYGCLHYSGEKYYDEVNQVTVGMRTYCDNKTITFLQEEADYKNDNQSFYSKSMDTYWDNYSFRIYDWIYAYYYSDDESPVDMQKTACNFLVMADWYVESTDSTEDTEKNTMATDCQPDLAPKFIVKVTEAYDKNENTVRVYYFDGTSIRNALVRPKYYKGGEGHVDNDITKAFLPEGFPVRISTDGAYIEDIAPYYDTLYFNMYDMVKPIFNVSTSSYVTPFKPFYQQQSKRWNTRSNEWFPIRHYCGIITSIDEVVNNKLFSIAAATNESEGDDGKKVYDLEIMPNERLEGNVFKLNFDRTGHIASITRGTLEDILPGQLVIVRKRANNSGSYANWEALTGYAVNEFFIISEDAAELDYLKDFYNQVQEEVINAAK